MCFICLKDKASDILPFVATVKESNGRIPSTRGLVHSFLNRSYKGKGCNILTIIAQINRQTISDETDMLYVLLEHLQSRIAKSAHDLSKNYLESDLF